ncbi:hypothetical protein SK355_13805 [Candidatus Fukatsuia symbiotica]|uniref:Uncharacterized protein n=1 Tax=Candidatus Fukatsuia symbiotica TaxID=1878942 RepID=A0A2U8I973_9GAMM|nr:hypothetical protein [Candidatus Fukatsuia symbiotica]AWK15618.1 hypothetical protein CCS41_14465 [Candidatus Fukatsuia symbiotica]MEA9446222.1 hypothetical protein [Candidatus Fukatsuia symbiotica]
MKNHCINSINKNVGYSSCDSPAVFILNNGQDTFALHLEILLDCLRMAQDHGHVPALDSAWWQQAINYVDKQL